MSRLLDLQDFVRDKLAWQHRALTDPALSVSAKTVAALMMHDLNVSQGGAWRAQDGIAALIGLSVRQVRRSLAELKAAGYLQIDVGKGRSRTNVYRAMMPDIGSEPGSPAPENRTLASSQTEQKRTPVSPENPENRTSATGKQDMGVRQYLEESITPPYPPRPERQRQRSADPSKAMIRSGPVFLDRRVRQAFVAIHGEPAAISWLDPQRWEQAKALIVCRSPTAYAKLCGDYRKTLAEIGVRVVLDATRFSQLPCPTFYDRLAA
ncbi:helix-turn-helix domain-containing protein [uncultured Brevundimonas sp.]|uniref:helix-turn-helix domain-containing protein n=1 Tax=uncultured Brevundimonas sp. TaxID=213418 RepID=UPI00261AFAF4|nr:helix-turn-helix domain-containing protein [uncultured Brevundimonas sp.]